MLEKFGKSKAYAMLRVVSVSTTNQVVTSGTNFVLGLYLIRILTVSDFGVYGILQAAAFVLAGFGNSLFLGQMVVHYPDEVIDDRTEYVASILFLIVFFSCIVLFMSAALFVIFGLFYSTQFEYWSEIFSVIVFSIGYLCKEFFCRLAYTHRREARALRVNITIAVSLLLSISGTVLIGIPLSAHFVLYCYAMSAAVGVIVGQLEVRLPLRLDWRIMLASLRQVLVGGKWALASDILYSGRQQAHVFITAAIAGPTGVGMINAAKLFLTPIMLLTPSLSQLYIVRLVALRQLEPLKLLRGGIMFSAANAASVLFYGLVLILSFQYVSEIVLTDSFPKVDSFVVAWFYVALFSAARYGLETTQKALKRFKLLTMVNIPITLVALGAVYLLLVMVGPVGAVYGLALAELLLALVLARQVLLSVKQLKPVMDI